MKKYAVLLAALAVLSAPFFAAQAGPDPKKGLEPFTYKENFETNELSAWASYPLWQDTAFDPNMRPNTIVPGDPNISLVERVTPYTHVDNYAGAQKLLDMVFLEDSVIRLRAYLKTELKPEFLKVRLAAGPDGAVDFTVAAPPANTWHEVSVRYQDFVRENPGLKGRPIKVNALAVLAKFPLADPAMPIYFGLDDVVFEGARPAHFQFAAPKMHKLSEWKPYIPDAHYKKGDTLTLEGKWPLAVDRVDLTVTDFTKKSTAALRGALRGQAGAWTGTLKLNLPEGLYLGTLTAYAGREKIAATEFTVFIEPPGLAGKHPRLRYDASTIGAVKARLAEPRFQKVRENLLKRAKDSRTSDPVDKLVFDVDCFPDDEPLIGNVPRSLPGWSGLRVRAWREALNSNALAYALLGDEEAGKYAKDYLVKFCEFPFWVHPWWEKRGQHIYYPVGELGMDAALGYDLVYDLLDEPGRKIVRDGLWRNVIAGCHRSYVQDNLVTSSTSNWAAHITSGSLMAMASTFADGAGDVETEPYLTGALLKLHKVIEKSSGRDGGYGESYGYCSFTMLSLAKSLPALANVFDIDFSGTLDRTYQDVPWSMC